MTGLHLTVFRKFAFLLALLLSASVYADEIKVEGAWARATPRGDMAQVFMYVTSPQDAVLVGASSPVAQAVEMRTMEHKGGRMRTYSVDSVKLPAKRRMDMTSIHSYHLALVGLKAPLKETGTVPVTLEFETAGQRVKTEVQAEIRPPKKPMQR